MGTPASSTGERVLQALAVVLAAFFVLSVPPLLTLRAAVGTALDRDLVIETATREVTRSDVIRRAGLREFISQSEEGEFDEFLARMTAYLSIEEWQRIGEIAVPDGWIEGELTRFLEDLYVWIETDSVTPTFTLNTEPVKRRFVGAGSEEMIGMVIESWPACSQSQVEELERAFREGGELPILECQPPEPYRSLLTNYLADAFRREVRQLPSEVVYGEETFAAEAGNLLEMKSVLRTVRFLSTWGFLAPLSLLGLIMALAVRSWRGWTRWWGIPIALSGLLSLGLVAWLAASRPEILASLLRDMEAPAEVVASVERVLAQLYAVALRRNGSLAAVLAAAGFVLFVIGFLLPGRNRPKTIGLTRRPL